MFRPSTDAAPHDFMAAGGWSVIHAGSGNGLVAHRGLLHPDEYVDAATLRSLVEARLGFTYEEVRSVYCQGPKSAAQMEQRSRIDARLLGVAEAGGNMTELGRALGFAIKENGNCRTLGNALARARAAAQPM